MGYADLDVVAGQILPDGTASDEELMARLARIDDEISRLIDIKTGRSFGESAASSVRTLAGVAAPGALVLMLPTPLRTITSIEITGAWIETVPETDYALTFGTQRGDYLGVRRIAGGGWPFADGRSVIAITGGWSDASDGSGVPPEIVAAVNFLVADHFRLESSSPAGEIGPDGMTVRPRNPWNFEIVKTAIDRYRVALPVPVF